MYMKCEHLLQKRSRDPLAIFSSIFTMTSFSSKLAIV